MKPVTLAVAVALLGISVDANAGLLARNVGGVPSTTDAYYDSVLNITWLRDANFAMTSGFASGGLMTFTDAQSWASGLKINGFNGWRLANVAQPDPSCESQNPTYGSTGSNCTGGELGYMYYTNLGGSVGTNLSTSHNANYDLFSNIGDDAYWSATARTPDGAEPHEL